jgi:uncharacterized membrane protein
MSITFEGAANLAAGSVREPASASPRRVAGGHHRLRPAEDARAAIPDLAQVSCVARSLQVALRRVALRRDPGFPSLPTTAQGAFMTKTSARTIAAISSLLALGTLSVAPLAIAADKPDVEKCYGIAKAGKNDCAGAAHACSGQSKQDAGAKEWVSLPKGTCERIVGGSLTPK